MILENSTYIYALGFWSCLFLCLTLYLIFTKRFCDLIKKLKTSKPILGEESLSETTFHIMGGISLFVFMFEKLITYTKKDVSHEHINLQQLYYTFLPLIQIVIFVSLTFIFMKVGQKLAYGLASDDPGRWLSLIIIVLVMLFILALTLI